MCKRNELPPSRHASGLRCGLSQAADPACRWNEVRSLRHSVRHVSTLAALVLATVVGFVSVANAASGDEAVDQLKHEAIEALKRERDLTGRAQQSPNPPAPSLQQQIKVADEKGVALLEKLTARGFEPSPIVVATLGRLPAPAPGGPESLPTRQHYDDAIGELRGEPGRPPVQTVSDGGWTDGMVALVAVVAALSAVCAIALVMMVRRRKDSRLVDLAMTDSLTALCNRRRLDDDLAVCTTKQLQPVGVLMVDVDNFKMVNDLQGHAAGDRVLQHVGAILAKHVRPTDVAYRYGGEEFCVLLPDATEADAFGVAERIREATSALRIPGVEPITVSVGVAIGTGAEVQQTLERADAAMYGAKRDGRDRVALASVGVSSPFAND